MNLLDGTPAVTIGRLSLVGTPRSTVLEVEAGQDHASVVEAGGPRLVYPNLTLFFLVVPYSGRLVSRTRHKSTVSWVQIDLSYHV